jgi:ketosteroid isomerase-like protein
MRIAPNCSIIFSVKQLMIYGICAMGLTASAIDAQTPRPQAFIEVLLNTFVDAQLRFDVQQLDAVLAPDYVEISPAGEVDPRAKVLGFYAPDKKVADPPAAALDEISTRVSGDTAITIARLTYRMKGPDGAPAERAMRCVFVTRIIETRWKLVSTQYTPIRK